MRVFIRLLLVVLGLGGWVLAGVLALLLYTVFYRPWDDPTSAANRMTGELLAYHEQYPQAQIVLDWLNANHGEAPSLQVMFTFVDWAIDHKSEAQELLSVVMPNPQKFAERVAFAATDSGDGCAFRMAFAQGAVPLIVTVVSEIERIQDPKACG